jgi:hypothetical protein
VSAEPLGAVLHVVDGIFFAGCSLRRNLCGAVSS